MTVVKEISKYKSDFVGIEEVRWDRRIYIFLWKGEWES
jgi:hypothetical protein